MSKWIAKFPTPNKEETKWWFYGWAFGKLDPTYIDRESPELIIVSCTKVETGYVFIGNGHFIYESEAVGVFKVYKSIDTPNVDELKKMIAPDGENS